jgi:membrane associated rhomboid family serine protease
MGSHKSAIAKEVKTQATILLSFTAILWVLELVDIFVLGQALNRFGILPRNVIGLRGVLLAPFLHGGWFHLVGNTIPFLTLGWFTMLQETSDFFIVSLVTMIVSGIGVWLFGSAGMHIGASGIIFGYLGFLLLRGYFQRNLPSILLSVIVFFLYGGMIWGVLPTQLGISWEGHLFGFIGGGVAARMIAKEKRYLKD